MLGKIREEIVGKHYSTLLSIPSLGLIEDRIRRFQAGEKMPSLFELELLHHNGATVRVEARTRPITDKNGSPIGFQGVYRDITKRAAMKNGMLTSQATPLPSESNPAHGTTPGISDSHSSNAGLGSSFVPTDIAVPPWSQLPSHPGNNTEAHYPAGYSPLSQNTSEPSTPLPQKDLEGRDQSSPLPHIDSSFSPSSFSIAESPSTQTLEIQSSTSTSAQFQFTNSFTDVSESHTPSTSLAEQSESSMGLSQFTFATDRQKKEERQAKVVPFPVASAHALSIPPQLGSALSQQILNLNEALDRVDGDRELLREMAGVFLDEYPLLLVTMQDALSHGNAQTLTYAVHTLKGSVANFAATNAFEAALKLEKIGRQGNLTQAKNALAELEAELARLAPLLTTLKMEAAA